MGKALGELLLPGSFVALAGDLGAGKTWFAGGVAAGIGVPDTVLVTSPTFTILNEYHGRIPLYHFDLYRLSGPSEIIDLGFDEYFCGNGASLVEWPERLGDELPADHVMITLMIAGESSREMTVEGHGESASVIVENLRKTLKKCFDPLLLS